MHTTIGYLRTCGVLLTLLVMFAAGGCSSSQVDLSAEEHQKTLESLTPQQREQIQQTQQRLAVPPHLPALGADERKNQQILEAMQQALPPAPPAPN